MRAYTSRVERQVKERLVGAAVLVALAVILIPELLSGPGTRQKPPAQTTRSEQNIKTYEFKLDGTPTSAPARESMPPREESLAPPSEHVPEFTSDPQPAQAETPAPATRDEPRPEPTRDEGTKTPAPTPAPAASERGSSPASTPGWAVQLGSFADAARAQRLADKLETAGHNAYLVPLRRADGKTLQRVRIGPYSQRAAAEVALKQVSGDAKGATVVAQP